MRYDKETTLVIVINVLFIVILTSAVLLAEFTVEALMLISVQKHYNAQRLSMHH